ncbi:CHAT domain-containing protein [Sinosporangium album]|uniref:CHAT domain-containing protein n=1 Tax=Sinosporangium album TaxID=504805 RepID=A0A1G7X3K7_9ACTN|nr:effector-associated domain EAD1-containing protein [Sinosporangium album]SDG78773.1 CHAT domain-containing protein [Sinosporangium album]
MITYDEARRNGVITALAQVFDSEAKSYALLEDMGVDRTRLPHFGSLAAEFFWRQVVRELAHGMAEPGLTELVDTAYRLYPGNEVFRRYSGAAPSPAAPPAAPGATRPLRVLCLQSAPGNTAELRLDREYREMLRVAETRTARGLEVVVSPATRADDIQRRLLSGSWDVVHFSGHGTSDGRLLFEDRWGDDYPVSVEVLAEVFEAAAGTLECVVLASCYSGAYAAELLRCARAVAGSSTPISDDCAIAFVEGFYEALAEGRDARKAFDNGKSRMRLLGCGSGDMHFEAREGHER